MFIDKLKTKPGQSQIRARSYLHFQVSVEINDLFHFRFHEAMEEIPAYN